MRKKSPWILCKDRLPDVSYDYLGNWSSSEVLLLMNDQEFLTICNGHYNPVGMFEVEESDGPAGIGAPVTHVVAWMPIPEPLPNWEEFE